MTKVVGSINSVKPRLRGHIHEAAEVLRGEEWCRGVRSVWVRGCLPVLGGPVGMRSRGEVGGLVS